MNKRFESSLNNTQTDLSTLIASVKSFLSPYDLTPRVQNATHLVLEESILNIIQHGYSDGDTHDINVKILVETNQIAIELIDDGKQFNPLSRPHRTPPTNIPAEEDTELGIHLMRNLMHSMAYSRNNGKNILEVWIRR